jgi:hypothetical protein
MVECDARFWDVENCPQNSASSRKCWQSEDYQMSMFDAAALGIAYFTRPEINVFWLEPKSDQ